MPNSHFDRRPELNRTVIFGEEPQLDSDPIEVQNGRLIPGPQFSQREFELLWQLASGQEQGELSEEPPLPTQKQLARISLHATLGCWDLPVYNDPLPRARYGNLSINGVLGRHAHQVMYRVFYGSESIPQTDNIPPSFYHLDHLCQRKSCCYPRHLEPVRPAENTRRGFMSKDIGQLWIEFE